MSNKDGFLEWFKTIAISTKGERYKDKTIEDYLRGIEKAVNNIPEILNDVQKISIYEIQNLSEMENLYAKYENRIKKEIDTNAPDAHRGFECYIEFLRYKENIDNNAIINSYLKKYNEFKDSSNYYEQDKWKFAIKNKGLFNSFDNFEEIMSNLKLDKSTFKSWFMRQNGINWMLARHLETTKAVFYELFDEKQSLLNRINNFRESIKRTILADVDWKNKNICDADVTTASYYLFAHDYTKYLLYTSTTPFNNYAKKFDLKEITNVEKVEKYINWHEYCFKKLIPIMDKFFNRECTLLDAQDFIWYVGNLEKHTENNKQENNDEDNNQGEKDMADNQPKNLILYGPPGTGKTYNTVIEAMRVISFEHLFKEWFLNVYCENKTVDSKDKTLKDYLTHLDKINQEFLKNDNIFRYDNKDTFAKLKKYILESEYINNNPTRSNKNSYYQHGLKRYEEFLEWLSYDKIKQEFDKYKEQGRIEFVTFHQSYSYEEFVEGIKPDIQEWEDDSAEDIKYVGKNGLFKNISNNALFDIIEINNEKEKNELNFSTIMENFIEEYPIGTTIETTTNLKFKIVDYYKNKSIRVCPNGGISTFSVSWEPLQEMLEEYQKGEIKSPNELGIRMKGKYKSLATYYFPILKNLVDIAKKDDYQDEESKVKLSIDTLILDKEFKNKIIKNYYDKQLKLKDDINIKPYILIIDEINRGNISKIFGELITLIEEDKRLGEKHELKITLPYSQDIFGVPSNLYIIGTMNTSDRSIASVDIALRRRFKFKEMMPDLTLIENFEDNGNSIDLKEIIKTLNKRISALLDRDHQIGHSYFINVNSIGQLKQIWFDSVMPLLNEYFYGDWEKLQAILGNANEDFSFIEKIETKGLFANDTCDVDECYDFRDKSVYFNDETNQKFINALSHAFFGTLKKENSKNLDSGNTNEE